MSYLRLTANVHDNLAFERVVNFPTRGIGNTTLDKVREFANNNSISLWDASSAIIPSLPPRASNSLKGFLQLITSITDEVLHKELKYKIETILNSSTLLNHYIADNNDKAQSKKENLEELITAASQYNHDDSEGLDEVMGFISLASLDSANDSKKFTPSVQLMSIHSAKGLEFGNVFVVGLEEDLFPSRYAKETPDGLNEERRLCYVAMTRAMKKLHLSHAEKRFMHGQTFFAYPSRFLSEVPSEYFNKINNKDSYNQDSQNSFSDTSFSQEPNDNSYNIGTQVKHIKFGFGTITNLEGDGESARVQVNFKKYGSKWLIASYAKLERIG
jgi:DNA helicase-2/ATP-dependent DNA helicase PcrA